MTLPPGYVITQGGQTEEQTRGLQRASSSALGVAVLLMYLVLVVQFGSFLDPLAIMLSLPLSLIGVVGALMLTGDTLNIMSLIGVILLMGIVAKNAILLIDFAKWSEEKGMPRREAIIEAGRARLRPILMTTFALIAGHDSGGARRGEGADFRAPLGRAIIGGVITSTLLTLLVIPTFYDILAGMRDRTKRLFGRGERRSRIRGRRSRRELPLVVAGQDQDRDCADDRGPIHGTNPQLPSCHSGNSRRIPNAPKAVCAAIPDPIIPPRCSSPPSAIGRWMAEELPRAPRGQ